jgi:pyruvate formate lyase activating enzyme
MQLQEKIQVQVPSAIKDVLIGGFEPVSMLERPGLISAIVFMAGCNFNCPFCHNPELVFNVGKELTPYPLEEILKQLEIKRDWIDSVIFTGGEPMVHKDLPLLMSYIKERGFQVGVHTNGANPMMLKRLIDDGILSYIAMDIKNHPSKYQQTISVSEDKLLKLDFANIQKSIDLIKTAGSHIDTIFRTTVVPGLIEKEDIPPIGELIQGAKKVSLQQFRPRQCLNKDYEKIKPYTKEELNQMADILEKYVEEVERDFI